MIIFTSDHGEMLGENNLWGKLGWWDSSYRIPLIIHVPGQQPRLVNEMTESVDLAPTILEWLEGDIPVDWNGRSLVRYLNNQKNEISPKDYVVFDYDFREWTSFVTDKKLAPEECNLSVIRTKRWKYVHFPSLPSLLFNMEDDPNEIKNLADLPEYQSIKNELLSKLLSHRMLHQERQLSNTMLSSKGVKINSGPNTRRLNN
jgi:arylsulfatase A-like enzyme